MNAAVPDAAVPTGQIVTAPKTLLVGEIAEGVLAGGAGDRALITVATAPAFDWNIHGHANGSTQTVQEGFDVTSVTYEFAPTATADWYLLLRNTQTTALTLDVKLELFGTMTWSGWE